MCKRLKELNQHLSRWLAPGPLHSVSSERNNELKPWQKTLKRQCKLLKNARMGQPGLDWWTGFSGYSLIIYFWALTSKKNYFCALLLKTLKAGLHLYPPCYVNCFHLTSYWNKNRSVCHGQVFHNIHLLFILIWLVVDLPVNLKGFRVNLVGEKPLKVVDENVSGRFNSKWEGIPWVQGASLHGLGPRLDQKEVYGAPVFISPGFLSGQEGYVTSQFMLLVPWFLCHYRLSLKPWT